MYLHGRGCWMCLPVSTWALAAQTGLCQTQEGQGTRTVLWTAHLPWRSKARELCSEEAQEKGPSIWRRPHQQEWIGSCVGRRTAVFSWWVILLFKRATEGSVCIIEEVAAYLDSLMFPLVSVRSANLLNSLFSDQLSGVTQWGTWSPEQPSVCLRPQLGLLAPNPAALVCPQGSPTAMPSAN